MPEGTIKKLTDKGFGFIALGGGKDLFFHSSGLEGVQFEDLHGFTDSGDSGDTNRLWSSE